MLYRLLLTLLLLIPLQGVLAAEGAADSQADSALFGSEDDLFGAGDDLFGEADALNDAATALDEPESGEMPSLDTGLPGEESGGQDLFADEEGEIDLFADLEVDTSSVVEVPPEKSRLLTIGGPIALMLTFFLILWINKITVPFRLSEVDVTFYHFPTGVKRGLAIAITLYGIAFAFGASEIVYQIKLYGNAGAYFEQMSLGKLIAFTHAHLFGFTTSFLIIGIPFSLQFNHIPAYQWIFPAGLAAAVVDVASWWGIKYISINFEIVSFFCGFVFSATYLFMLVGMLRVLLFPNVIWLSDKDREERIAKQRRRRKAQREDISGAL